MQAGKLSLTPGTALVLVVLLAALVGLAVGAWHHPPVLVYAVVAAAGLGTYAAVYFIVLSALRRARSERTKSS